ncbi:MAG: FAD-dependent oxidoreductase [bacterium]
MRVNAAASRTAADHAHGNPDVVIIGDGVIGLTIARDLGRAGARCRVFGASEVGAASGAAAGLLAPSVGRLSAEIQQFFEASLALYPDFVDSLRAFEPELAMIAGLIEIFNSATPRVGPATRRLSRDDVALLEPALQAPHGGLFHARDGAIDNVALMRALRRAVAAEEFVDVVADDPVAKLDLSADTATVVTRGGKRVAANTIVLAAGAWSMAIAGLPRRLPVAPMKGQMLAVASTAIFHAVLSEDVYLVPRAGEIVIGATAEHAGFDVAVVPAAIAELQRAAITACPTLADAPVLRSWAGLRPATPDMLPIIGPDPDDGRLLYACGHSKNGILLAPATAAAIVTMVLGSSAVVDVSAFGAGRFSNGKRSNGE